MRTRVVWLRCAKVGKCMCGAGTMQSLHTVDATRSSTTPAHRTDRGVKARQKRVIIAKSEL